MNKAFFAKYYKTCPGLFVVLGLLTSLIPLNIGLSFLWILPLAVCISTILILTSSARVFLHYLLWCLIGAISFYVNLSLVQTDVDGFSFKKGLYVDIKFKANDNSLTANKSNWPEQPKNIFGYLYEMKAEEDGEWKNSSGKLYISNRDGYKFLYGKSYEASGMILPAQRGQNNAFANYLKSIGVLYVFYPDIVKEVNGHKSWRSTLTLPVIELRDKILSRCVTGISDISVKDFLAGILFGFRQGLDFEERNKFLETGTIHIIAISGTHIGILALLFMFLLKPLPIRLRYFSVPVVLLIYIVAIGYLHSAVRAFMMVSIFFLLKACLRVSNPFNILFFTCSIMLILNPYSLLNIGFQFSYLIVLFLMLGWRVSEEIKNCCAEKGLWIPKKRIGHSISVRSKVLEKLFLGVSATLIAGVASIPLQLYFNGLVTPIMPLSNILVLPLIFPLFLVSIVKVLCVGLIPHLISVDLLNFMLKGLVNGIFGIVNFSYDTGLSFYLRVPNAGVIIFFYLILIAVLMLFNKRLISFLLLTVLGAVTLLIVTVPHFYPDRLVLMKLPHSNSYSAILLDSAQSSATIVNCPKNSYYNIENILKKEGINVVERILLTGGNKESSGDAVKLLEIYKKTVKSVAFEKTLRISKLINEIKLFCKENEIRTDSFQTQKDGAEISFLNKGRKISLLINSEGQGETKYTVLANNSNIASGKFENNNEVQVIQCDL